LITATIFGGDFKRHIQKKEGGTLQEKPAMIDQEKPAMTDQKEPGELKKKQSAYARNQKLSQIP